jgi:acyl-CoA synthetase (AMP-forming)/AMP-acid ligase II/1-acyl-sn-glycerol-3-phosphate acyltransferase/acyl carrier protein
MATTPKQLDGSSIEEQVLGIVRELLIELGSERAAHHATLHSSLDRDLGLGSLERVELLVRSEARFQTHLADEIAQEAETPADLVRAVLEGGSGTVAKTRYRIVQPTREAPPPPTSAASLVEVLRRHVEVEPDRVHIHLLEEDWGQDITYRQLLASATKVAAGLRAAGLKRDDCVAIMLPTCAEFFQAFFGVVLAGGIAVPIYPPARPDKIEEYVRRQVAILRNAEVRFLIGFDRVKAVSKIMRVSIPSLIDATTVEALREAGEGAPKVIVDPAETAFIQYTSGSTGDPKGVVLKHSNILANVQGIGHSVQVRPTDIGVSWLPLYHDMGLIGSWLFCLFYAVPITILSPIAFLTRPERWLWALSDSGATLCPAPNFAYELCARKIPDSALEGLDLSRWRIAINAGEAVHPETLERFAERFKPYGFHAESYVPCYGLAESTVALAFPPVNRLPVIDTIQREPFETEGRAAEAEEGETNVIRFVANGRPMPGHEIRIVDEQGNPVGERQQGRVFFRGPSRTSGYFRNPKATAAIITDDGWMDSGDLAYWADGEIFVTGRLKDCIIKSGRNIIPQEVEAAAAEVSGVRRGCIAAFGTVDETSGTERLVVAAETRAVRADEMERIEAAVIEKIDSVLGIPPDHVVLVRPHAIPKTSSGKIRRNETRRLYLAGQLNIGKRAPWVQIVRLRVANFGSWLELNLQRFGERVRRAFNSVTMFATASVAGISARMAPGKRAAAGIVQSAARFLLNSSGERVGLRGDENHAAEKPALYVANRAGKLDPLVLAARLNSPLLVADSSALNSVPAMARFLLQPLVVPCLDGDSRPAGSTLRERIEQALREGHSVMVFADSAVGASPERSRFRLEAFQAAVNAGCALRPIGIRGTAELFGEHRRTSGSWARIRIGEPIVHHAAGHKELIELRERVRHAIGKLCG